MSFYSYGIADSSWRGGIVPLQEEGSIYSLRFSFNDILFPSNCRFFLAPFLFFLVLFLSSPFLFPPPNLFLE